MLCKMLSTINRTVLTSGTSEAEHQTHVKKTVVAGIGSDDAEHRDDRQQNPLGNQDDLADAGSDNQAEHQQADATDEAAGENRGEHLRLRPDEHWPRLQPVDVEDRKDDRCDRVARNGKRQHGNQGSSDTSVVAGLAGDDAFHRPCSKRNRRVSDNAPALAVGEKGRDRSAGAGERPDQGADQTVVESVQPISLEHLFQGNLLPGNRAYLGLHVPAGYGGKHLRHAEQSDQGGDRGNPRLQVPDAEGHARGAHDRVQADHADAQAEHGADQSFAEGPARQGTDGGKPEEREQKVVHRLELQCDPADRLGDQPERGKTEDAADEGVDRGVLQRAVCLPFLGERVPVEGRDDARRRAGNIDQDRAERSAEDTDDVQAHDGGKGVVGRPRVGDRDQKRGRHGDGKARNGAHEQTKHRTDDDKQDEAGLREEGKNGSKRHGGTSGEHHMQQHVEQVIDDDAGRHREDTDQERTPFAKQQEEQHEEDDRTRDEAGMGHGEVIGKTNGERRKDLLPLRLRGRPASPTIPARPHSLGAQADGKQQKEQGDQERKQIGGQLPGKADLAVTSQGISQQG